MGYAAVVLAGGAGSRLGGAAKPVLPVGGRPMLHRVLAAVADASARIVVGPPALPLPEGVRRTLEEPPGSGPVAATAAGLALVGPDLMVALLAADLPLLTPLAIRRLRTAAGRAGVDGALFVDESGHPQWLCGVWRTGALRAALAHLVDSSGSAARPPYAGVALRRLLGNLRAVHVRDESGGKVGDAASEGAATKRLTGDRVATGTGLTPAPWWDCDTRADLQRAEELLHGDAG